MKPTTTAAARRPTQRVSRHDITIDHAFNFRHFGIDKAHVRTLVQALRNTDRLTPVLLWKDERKEPARLVLLDGHHRLEAYEATKWERRGRPQGVPAIILEGTFAEAMSTAVAANSKDAIPLTQREKTDAAWRLVRTFGKDLSKNRVAVVSGVSQRTVGNMRQRLKVFEGTGKEPTGFWWKDIRDEAHPYEHEDDMTDAQRAEVVYKLAGEFKTVAARRENRQIEIVADALEKAFGQQLKTMCEYLYGTGEDPCDMDYDESDDEDIPF